MPTFLLEGVHLAKLLQLVGVDRVVTVDGCSRLFEKTRPVVGVQ